MLQLLGKERLLSYQKQRCEDETLLQVRLLRLQHPFEDEKSDSTIIGLNQLSNTTIWWLDICSLLHRYQLHVSALMAIFRLKD